MIKALNIISIGVEILEHKTLNSAEAGPSPTNSVPPPLDSFCLLRSYRGIPSDQI